MPFTSDGGPSFSTATSQAATLPGGRSAGDLLLLHIPVRVSGTAGTNDAISVSTGWAQHGSRIRRAATSADVALEVWWRIATNTAADAATVTVGTNIAPNGWGVHIVGFSNINQSSPFDVAAVTSSGTANIFTPTGVTTVSSGTEAYSFVAVANSTQDPALIAPLNGFFTASLGSTVTGLWLAEGVACRTPIGVAGAVTQPTWQETGATQPWVALATAVRLVNIAAPVSTVAATSLVRAFTVTPVTAPARVAAATSLVGLPAVVPQNDTRAAALALSGDAGSVSGATVAAAAEPGTVYASGYRDVWYTWPYLAPGLVTLAVGGLGVPGEVAAWASPPSTAGFDNAFLVGRDAAAPYSLTFDHPGGPLTVAVATVAPGASTFTLDWSTHDAAGAEMIGEGVMEAAALVAASGASAVMIGEGLVSATSPAKGHRPRAIVVDQHGNTLCELPDAKIGSISYGLNEPESWSLTLLQNDPAIAFTSVPFQEVQVWRGDQLLAWGPCTRWGFDQGYWTGQYKGAAWYLTRRYVGKANRHNWVTNGSFEDGLAGWTGITNQVWNYWGNPGAQATPPEVESVTSPRTEGRRAVRERNFVGGNDAWLSQDFFFTVDAAFSPEGDTFTLKGYLYLTAPIPDGAGSNEGRGLYLERFSTTQLDPSAWVQEAAPGAPLSLETSFVKLDESTPVGVWQRFETEFVTPPKGGEPEIINVRLYAPANIDVFWDAISLTLIEKLAFYNVDQAAIVAGLVAHLQDGYYDKSNLNITTDTAPTGVIRTRVYIHSEHPPGWRAITEFNELDDGLDFRMVYTPTQRIFTTFYPRSGVYKPYPVRLETEAEAGNIATWSVAYDGEQASSSVIVLGTGSGSDREEGGAVDVSGWANGVTMEEVFTSPDETPLDSLGAMANERLRAARSAYTVDVTLYPPQGGAMADLIGNVWPGDDIDVTILRHTLDIEGVWRIVKLTVDLETQAMSLTLNPPFTT